MYNETLYIDVTIQREIFREAFCHRMRPIAEGDFQWIFAVTVKAVNSYI